MANVWTTFSNLPTLPNGFAAGTMVLLTDGSVLVHNENYVNNAYVGYEWFRLTPDTQGHYDTGTWAGPYSMANARQFFASGILKDGRFFVLGGEYCSSGNDSALAEIFDPTTNVWSALANPYPWVHGDCSACVLADGRVLFGSLNTSQTAIWNPGPNTWVEAGTGFGSVAATKAQGCDEESWTLLPDGSVLTVSIATPAITQKYVPSIDKWIDADQVSPTLTTTLPLLSLNSGATSYEIGEIGPAVVLPNGKLFAIGATGHTALYTPPAVPTDPGTWAAGPNMPADTSGNNYNSVNGNIQTAIDAPAVLLTGGKVLCCAGNTIFEGGSFPFWSNPSNILVYDPVANTTPTPLDVQPPSHSNDTWQARFLLLPTGQVLFTRQGNIIEMLTVDNTLLGSPQNAWRPVITGYTAAMNAGNNYVLYGYQFNGLSQACAYGDDAQMATNYPIVRITNTATNAVKYLRSFNFSTLGIATGTTTASTTIAIPAGQAPGSYRLEVVANGIPSSPVNITIAPVAHVFLNGGYQSADIIITDLATSMPVPLGGMPGGAWDTLLKPNTQYGFSATVHNDTAATANGVEVSFWAIPGGVGTSGSLLATVPNVSVPANSFVVVASPVNFTSAPGGDHMCAVVSLHNPATGCNVNPGSNALLIPDPGLAGDHGCSAWRNTDSTVVGPHSKFGFGIGFGKIPVKLQGPIRLQIEPVHVPASWREIEGVKDMENILNITGAKAMLPLYLLPALSKHFSTVALQTRVTVKRGGEVKEHAERHWHFTHDGRDEETQLEITGHLPATVKHGDIVLVMVTAHYPAAERVHGRTVQFLEVIHVLDKKPW